MSQRIKYFDYTEMLKDIWKYLMADPNLSVFKEGLGEKHMVYEGFKWRESDEVEVGS